MIGLSTTVRLSLGLALLTLSVVLVADCIGLIPSRSEMIFEGRKKFCESLAVQCAVSAEKEDIATIQAVVQLIVKRNDDILSAAIRTTDGKILAEAGSHQDNWRETSEDQQSLAQARVPIFKGRKPWGALEVRFNEIGPKGVGVLGRPLVKLVLFLVLGGFVTTLLFLRKTLRHVDLTSVVPSRVKSALDTLTEGVILVDKRERIVLVNHAFADRVGQSAASLLGRRASDLKWTDPMSDQPARPLPWTRSLRDGESQVAVPLALSTEAHGTRSFLVNAAPIFDERGDKRGVLATFDDVTELTEKNTQLQEMVGQLELSRNEIRRQNQKLQLLATRDSLTGCLNRRSFGERLDACLSTAQRHGHDVSCIMVDIDHFKAINDSHGHTIGDEVLQMVSEALRSSSRPNVAICRYGGEKFCLLLPHAKLKAAAITAERLRRRIETRDVSGIRVTASFGVSSIVSGATDAQELIGQADEALYLAKNSGRNKVVCWNEVSTEADVLESDGPAPGRVDESVGRQIPVRAVKSLVFALAHRDVGTAEHCRQVADLCVATAAGLMSTRECYLLEAAALLHDIGKLTVPDAILLKPGPLTEQELKVTHDHLRRGVAMVSSAFSSPELTETLRYNHTRYGDNVRGTDSPTGEDIPLKARILAIADAFSAMVSQKPYREARTYEEAFQELRRCSGEQFDPELVERFIEAVGARDGRRAKKEPEVSDAVRLEIGLEVERIAVALSSADLSQLSVTASQLTAMAAKQGVHQVAELAAEIEVAAASNQDLVKIVQLAADLMDACRKLGVRELETSQVP